MADEAGRGKGSGAKRTETPLAMRKPGAGGHTLVRTTGGPGECLVCRKFAGTAAAGPVLWSEPRLSASLRAPETDREAGLYRGWLLVEPRRHITGLDELDDDEARLLGWLMVRLTRALKAELKVDKVYAAVFGDAVPHVHLHLIPRHPGTPKALRGFRVSEWEDAPKDDGAARVALGERLRARLGP